MFELLTKLTSNKSLTNKSWSRSDAVGVSLRGLLSGLKGFNLGEGGTKRLGAIES